MTTPASSKWLFPSRLRARALGWGSSKLACQRIQEAVAEIQAVARHDPVRAAEGAILLIARLWPALEHVDSSSGAPGQTTDRAVHTLIDLIIGHGGGLVAALKQRPRATRSRSYSVRVT